MLLKKKSTRNVNKRKTEQKIIWTAENVMYIDCRLKSTERLSHVFATSLCAREINVSFEAFESSILERKLRSNALNS